MAKFHGFNPDQVRNAINKQKDAYQDLYDAVITVTQSAVITPMALLWASPEAKKFFTGIVKPAFDDLLKGINQTFKSIVDSMNSAASSWAKQTGASWSPIGFTPRTTQIDVSGIKEKLGNGDIGIDEIEAVAKAMLLNTKVYVKAVAALAKALAGVTVCGFLGGSQASNLRSAIKGVKEAIGDSTQTISEGAIKAIKETASNATSLGAKISDAFKG